MPRRIHQLPIILAALLGCGTDDPAAAARACDLQGQLQPSSRPVDTAQQRADSQFNTCLFVYDSAEKLRECLVLRFQWPTAEAARRIAVYAAEVRRVADSIDAEQRRLEAIRRAEISMAGVAGSTSR